LQRKADSAYLFVVHYNALVISCTPIRARVRNQATNIYGIGYLELACVSAA
jgi:hypothetical protein